MGSRGIIDLFLGKAHIDVTSAFYCEASKQSTIQRLKNTIVSGRSEVQKQTTEQIQKKKHKYSPVQEDRTIIALNLVSVA